MKKITLLKNARLSDLKNDYLTTILKHRSTDNAFINSENLSINVSYVVGNRSRSLFKLYDVKIESVEELVKLILFHLGSFDQNLRFDLIKLGYINIKHETE